MASSLPPLAQATSGALASVVSNLLVYPLDTVTTRMQTSKGHPTLLASLKKIARQDGWLSVYRGLGSDSLSTAISQFAYFFLYALLHKQFLRHKIRKAVAAELAPGAGKRSGKASPPILSALEGLLVGCLAGMVAKGIVAPLSNITVRQQTSSTAKAKAGDAERVGEEDSDDDEGSYSAAASMLEIARDILQEKGWTGLWSGYKSSIVLTTNPAITFYMFDLIKRVFIPARHREHPSLLQTFLAGAVASSIASAVTYPLILAKTRLQFKSPSGRRLYVSNADVFRKTIKKRGIVGMYAGLEGQLAKGFLSEGIKLTLKDRIELVIVLAHHTLMQQRAAI